MKDKRYKLIISDFDGTLLRSDGSIAEKTTLSIRNYCDRGGIFVICTGRMLSSIMPEAKKLGLKGLVAAHQGSVIADIESGKLLRSVGFEREDALKVINYLQSINARIHAYTIDSFYVNYSDEYLSLYERVCNVKAARTDDFGTLFRDENFKVVKIVVMTGGEKYGETLTRVSDAMGEEFYVTSSADALVEITPKTHTKGAAVGFLSEYYNIPTSGIIAIGDNLNDIPLLECSGFKIAVGNAREELKEMADEIAPSNDEGGVGEIIEKYGADGEI